MKSRQFWIRPRRIGKGPTWNCTDNLMNYAGRKDIIHVIEYQAYQSALDRIKELEEEVESKYYEGLLKGSEVGDATANKFKAERDDDMRRLGEERLEIYKSLKESKAREQRLVEALKKLIKTVPYNSIEPDYLIEARQVLAKFGIIEGTK